MDFDDPLLLGELHRRIITGGLDSGPAPERASVGVPARLSPLLISIGLATAVVVAVVVAR